MKQHHVTQNPDGSWGIKKEHGQRSIKNHDTKKQAVNHARNISRNQKSELFIHGRDGKIQSRDSHGNDPRNIKG